MSSNRHPSMPPNQNAFIGPNNTNLGPGPVIPDSIPSAKISRSHGDDYQPKREGSQGAPGTGSKSTHEDGRARLGSDADDSAFDEPNKNKAGQEGAKNPWRGPGGLKLGHGPRVDHLEKNEDGSFKLQQKQQSDDGIASGQGQQ